MRLSSEAPLRGFGRGAPIARGPKFSVASEDRQRMPGGPIAGTVVSPVGVIHAARADSDRVACGRSRAGLFEFPDLDFASVRSPLKCVECSTDVRLSAER